MIPIGLGISQFINRAMAEALKRMRLKPRAYPNRLSVPSGGGTMGLQQGSPHVPTQPLAPPVAEPELPELSLVPAQLCNDSFLQSRFRSPLSPGPDGAPARHPRRLPYLRLLPQHRAQVAAALPARRQTGIARTLPCASPHPA